MAQTGGTRGRIVGGRYRLGTMLGRGGMGTVWRAVDEMLHRDVAIKELRLPDHLDDEEKDLARERTLREARTAARIGHPNVVTIHDVVEDGGIPWIVMELVEAQSLAEILETQGTLTPADAAELGLKVLDALLAADAKGVLHRDVKPANILVTPQGRVVLTDFGIATATGTATLTATGMLVGSPDFLAPERAEGKRPLLAADLWSLAVVLYMAVEGRNPFRRGTMISTLNAILTDEADPPRHAGGLEPVIAGWLIKDSDRRMGAQEGERILREVANSTPSRQFDAATPPPPPTYNPNVPDAPTSPVGPYDPHEHAQPGHDTGAAQHPGGNTPPRAWPQPEYPPADALAPTRTASMAGGLPPHTPREPYPSAPQPEPRRGGSGRMIAVVALVVALIAGGVAVGIMVTKDEDKGAAAGPATKSPEPSGPGPTTPGPGSSTNPPSSGGPSTSSAPTPPPGYELVKDPLGFSLFLPKGTSASRTLVGVKKDQIQYTTVDRKTVYLIGATPIGNDPKGNFARIEPTAMKKPAYERLQLRDYTPVPPGSRKAALWEYTWEGDPIGGDETKRIASHAMNLGIVTNGNEDYALYVASYQSDWASVSEERFRQMTASFQAK
ncbi:protein kinase domain-containing protein [Embleya sp. NBC_00896]|uniref:serine/threonine-protein kinase n=1 Tax=Embleya sp. NBC_00896 TaxID=2975961 RepID=UPI00386E1D82|nr:protein kinase [Embleya sp. NBC_00896]